MMRNKARWMTVLLLVLIPLFYFYPAVRGEVVLMMGDSWSYSVPMRILLGRFITEGTLPLWNPYVFAGMPLLAAIQPGVFYPPNWLFAVLPPGVAINVVVITTYHLALIGSFLYARQLGLDIVAALVTGLTFTFGGFMISHLEQVNYIASAAWLPWLLLVVEKIFRSRSWREAWRWASFGAVVISLHVFAGLPQATLQIAVVCGSYFLFSLFVREDRPREWRDRRRFMTAIAVMALCGILISAIQLLPTKELQVQGERLAISYESFAAFSMPPRRLLSFVIPYFFGGAMPPIYHVAGWDHWWLHKYIHGYLGMIPLLLSMITLVALKTRRIVWFWAGVAVAALFLTFGDYLPFDINRLLYRIPVYNLFRGPYRHTLEFTFALAVLAGMGMDSIRRLDHPRLKRALLFSSTIIVTLVLGAVVIYLFFANRLGALLPPPPGGTSLINPEVFVPLILLGLSIGALWIYIGRKTTLSAALVVAVLLLDLASFGWFTYWRSSGYQLTDRLIDTPGVKAIKERESDLDSFRIAAYSINPYGPNYEGLSHGNLGIIRDLQSVSGYDPMRLTRTAAISGDIDIFGVINNPNVLETTDQGFNLLNVKYLFYEHQRLSADRDIQALKVDGIGFNQVVTETRLEPGNHCEFSGEGRLATELALISTMANSAQITDNALVAKIKIRTKDGSLIEREMLAGRDTAEWAYDHPAVKAQHRRAKIAESWPADGCDAHRYLARIPFDLAEIDRIEMDYLQSDGVLVIARASLYNSETRQSFPLERSKLPSGRWRKLGSFGEVELFENLKALPRAWFVSRVDALPSQEVLQTIRRGRLPDGQQFDPAQMALLEKEDFGGRELKLPVAGRGADAEVKVKKYEPQRIELETRNSQSGFLILSEVYYRGWDARVDGIKVPVERVNYTLRGIPVPPGTHQVEFSFRAPSFRNGAIYSALGVVLLLAGTIISSRKKR
jgi:hypothetical protein